LITVYGSNFTSQTASADPTQPYAPTTLGGATLYIDGLKAPLLYVSPTQINAQMPFEVGDRSSVTVWEVSTSSGSPVATNNIGTVIVGENPGLFAGAGTDPRPGMVYHWGPNATAMISVDGTIDAGDVATVYICDSACTSTTLPTGARTYNYTIQSTDTVFSVRDALVQIMANDPEVMAVATNTFSRILLVARTPGAAGDNIYYNVNSNTGSDITMTAVQTQLCCGGISAAGTPVTAADPAEPGEIVYTYATGLGTTDPSSDSVTGKYVTGHLNPTAIAVDSILAGGASALIVDATYVPGALGLYQVTFQVPASLTTNNLTQLTIAQQTFVSNIVTFPVAVP
jgi:uncharacterized protein (TIGR03437 family)